MRCSHKDVQALRAVLTAIQDAEFYRLTGKDILNLNSAVAALLNLAARIEEDLKPKDFVTPEPIKPVKGKK